MDIFLILHFIIITHYAALTPNSGIVYRIRRGTVKKRIRSQKWFASIEVVLGC